MDWFTHPHFVKYEVNYSGVVRNKRTKRTIKPVFNRESSKPRISVMCYGGKVKHRSYGAFVLEAINGVKSIDDFICYIDKDYTNNSYSNIKVKSKRIAQINPAGTITKIWNSVLDAKNLGGFHDVSITSCCKGDRSFHAGYCWCYEDDIPTTKVTLLVSTKGDDINYFGTTEQAYIFFKQKGMAKSSISAFRVNISKSKNKNKTYLGHKWTTVEKYIES